MLRMKRRTKRLTQEIALLHRRIDNIKSREQETKEIIASIRGSGYEEDVQKEGAQEEER